MPFVNAIHLWESVQQVNLLYLINVTEVHEHVNAVQSEQLPKAARLKSLLDKYKDRFPAGLPAKLPPERNVYNTSPLNNNNPRPPHKSYCLSRPEVEELDTQVASLLAKGYIQPSISSYGHPVLYVKKKNGNLRMCSDYR